MGHRATDVWKIWSHFELQSVKDRGELQRLTKTIPNLNEDGRKAVGIAMAEVKERISDRHLAAMGKAREVVAKGRAELALNWPDAREGLAASMSPDAAIATRQLAEGASANDLRTYVLDIVARRDLSAAHGLRSSIARREDLPEGVRGEIQASLDKITMPQKQAVLADLVGAQHAMAGLDLASGGNFFEGLLANPLAALQGSDTERVVLGRDGQPMRLAPAEHQRLLEASGIPLAPPNTERAAA